MDTQEKTQSANSAGFSETGLSESEAENPSAGETADWFKGVESDASSSELDWLKGLPPVESEQPAQNQRQRGYLPRRVSRLSRNKRPQCLKKMMPRIFPG